MGQLFRQLKSEYPNEWLVQLEVLELAKSAALAQEVREHLLTSARKIPKISRLITEGIEIVDMVAITDDV